MILAILNLLTAFLAFILGLMGLVRNRTSSLNLSFFIFSLMLTDWLFFYGLAYFADAADLKIFFFKLGYLGVIFIPTTLLVFITYFLNLKDRIFRFLIPSCVVLSIIFSFLCLKTSNFIVGLHQYHWNSYPDVNKVLHIPFLIFFVLLFTKTIMLLARHLFFLNLNRASLLFARIRFIFIGTIIGSFAGIDFLPNYGVGVYPLGFIFMLIFIFLVTYSIIRYRFLDIKLIITRTSIFICVYSFVLGLPFAFAFLSEDLLQRHFHNKWWIVPLLLSTVLATLGPYLFIYIQNKTEERLLSEQRAYQTTLRKASLGMGRVKNLRKLLNLIVHIVTRAVNIEHCEIYLFHESSNQYVRKAVKGNKRQSPYDKGVIEYDARLVRYLKRVKEPIVYEEVKQLGEDYGDDFLISIEATMLQVGAEIVVPSFIEQRLIAMIMLGKKLSGKPYSQDDLVVFSILANQAALSIENAMFYDDVKKTHEQLFKAEKMATVGTMADGLSHQINNRLHAMGFIAGDILDSVRMIKTESDLEERTRNLIDDVEYGLSRIQDNVKRGGEIVGGLLKYTRKGQEGFSPVHLNELLDSSFEMAQFKIKLHEITVKRLLPENLPAVRGNFTQLQEVFFNIIDNAYDAMMQRKHDLKEPSYKPRLEVSASVDKENMNIIITDNGIGVKKEDLNKIFTPFFTTKLSSKKGTGLGMYVIRQLIEESHDGEVEFSSVYMQGSETKIRLPLYQEADAQVDESTA